jgi:hypothetical protein
MQSSPLLPRLLFAMAVVAGNTPPPSPRLDKTDVSHVQQFRLSMSKVISIHQASIPSAGKSVFGYANRGDSEGSDED